MTVNHMVRRHWKGCTGALIASMLIAGGMTQAEQTQPEWQLQVNEVFGTQGEQRPGGVLRFDLTRNDVQPLLQDVRTSPDLSASGLVTFEKPGAQGLMIAELPLLESEVDAVVLSASDHGLRVEAEHNHFLFERPFIVFIHMTGVGDPANLARELKSVLARTALPLPSTPSTTASEIPGLNIQAIQQILGAQGTTTDDVFDVQFDRPEQFTYDGFPLPAEMTPISEVDFQPIGNGQAIVGVEIAVLPSETQAVIRALRTRGLTVTAVHNHLQLEEPRLYWVHAQGTGDQLQLATTVRKALDQTKNVPAE